MKYVVQFFDAETDELLAEEDIDVKSRDAAERFAEDFIADELEDSSVYYQIN